MAIQECLWYLLKAKVLLKQKETAAYELVEAFYIVRWHVCCIWPSLLLHDV